jgi:predicted NodU family carbamoyl transferase
MIILGLNAFHGDSASALVRDGVLVAAAEEERFRGLSTAQASAYPSSGNRRNEITYVVGVGP